MLPTIGRIVHYRGRDGLHALRPAIVITDIETLDLRAVEAGVIPDITDEEHVHLWVFTPNEHGGFVEWNVAHGQREFGMMPPGTWDWPTRVG